MDESERKDGVLFQKNAIKVGVPIPKILHHIYFAITSQIQSNTLVNGLILTNGPIYTIRSIILLPMFVINQQK